MGEIADALRRARGRVSGPSGEAAVDRLDLAAPEAAIEPPRPEARTESPAAWVDRIEPDSPAVLPEAGPHAELCRQIALRLRDRLEARGARSVAVVSAERGDGKSTVACNLAVAAASLSRGRKVALLDLDLRKPSLARFLDLSPKLGIESALRGEASLEETLISVRHPAIDVFCVKRPQHAAHELLVLPVVADLFASLERRYDLVVVDTPPAPLVPDASLILRHVPACVPVVRKGKTRSRSLKRLVQVLPAGRVAGWVVNCDRSSDFRDDDYYYHEGDGQ